MRSVTCMFAVSVLLLPAAQDARASERARWSEQRMCEVTEVIAFATVVSRESAYKPRRGVPMWTHVNLEVEALGHGNPPSVFTVLILGGEAEGHHITVSGTPEMPVAGRYLLFLRPFPPDILTDTSDQTRPKLPQTPPPGTAEAPYQVLEWWAVDRSAELPSADLMNAIWEEHCGTGLRPRAETRPTQHISPWLPPWFSAWCEHD